MWGISSETAHHRNAGAGQQLLRQIQGDEGDDRGEIQAQGRDQATEHIQIRVGIELTALSTGLPQSRFGNQLRRTRTISTTV